MLSTGRIATVMMVIRITRNIRENIDSSGRKMYLNSGWNRVDEECKLLIY